MLESPFIKSAWSDYVSGDLPRRPEESYPGLWAMPSRTLASSGHSLPALDRQESAAPAGTQPASPADPLTESLVKPCTEI